MRRKLVSFIISVVVLLSAFPFSSLTASAICCRKDFFDKSRYTLTGNMAEDVATIAKSQKGRTEAEFGYSGVDAGAWCDEFVADCIENAGADSSIVGHGGTVANFESVMREKGAIEVSSPQTGDLCFMTWSHVEIVTKVENGVVYCAGGNNAGGKCAGERSFSNSQIRLFLRPNYNNIPVPDLVTPTISTDKDSYTVGDTVNISWTASPAGSNLSHYWLVISGPNGEYPYAGTMNLNTSYSFVASQAGDYTITTYATPKGSLEGEGSLTDTKTISVQEKEIAWNMSLSTSSMNFILGQGQKSTTTLTVNGDMSKGGIVNTDDSGCKDIVDITYNNDGKKTSTQAIMSFTVTPKAVGSGNCLFYVTVNGTTVASVNLSISVTIDSCKVRLYDDGVIMAEYGIKCGTVFDDFLLPDMSKTGYTFEGWYTAESGGTKYSVGSKVPKISELNLYAHWSKYKFNVTRNTVTLNITDNSSEEIVFSFENIRSDDHPLVNIHTIRGEDRKISYTWGTWDNNSIKLTAKGVATGTETITFNLIDNDTKEVLATQKVTFIVEQNKCSVTWNSNFTGGTVKHTEYVWGDTFGAAADTPPENRTGYTFEGWYNGSIKITPDTLVPEKDALTLYASWKADGIYVSIDRVELTLDELIAADYRVTVPVRVSGSGGWFELGYGASWDTDKLTGNYVDNGDVIADANDKMIGGVMHAPALNNEKGVLWAGVSAYPYDDDNKMQYIEDGIIAYITFTVTPSAAAGDTYVITALEKGLDGTHGIISTADSRSVEYNMSNGAIIIKENPVYGDINQDGKTTITDAVALQKYLITLKTLTSEQLSLADINGDGRVNTFDLSLLKQLLK